MGKGVKVKNKITGKIHYRISSFNVKHSLQIPDKLVMEIDSWPVEKTYQENGKTITRYKPAYAEGYTEYAPDSHT